MLYMVKICWVLFIFGLALRRSETKNILAGTTFSHRESIKEELTEVMARSSIADDSESSEAESTTIMGTSSSIHSTDGQKCTSDVCSRHADCVIDSGNFTCICNEGYSGNGAFCIDIDECSYEACDVNAICTNTAGSYNCTCREGWSGNGTVCNQMEVITCKDDLCKDPQSFCTEVDNSYECPCKPGFYSLIKAPEICVQGLKFGGSIFLASSAKAKDPDETPVLRLLKSCYSNTPDYASVDIVEHDHEKFDYELIYEVPSEANEFLISLWFASCLSTEYGCNVANSSCQIDFPDGASFDIDPRKSTENAGNADKVVCSSFEEYCDSESTSCDSVDGYATCQCLQGYVRVQGAERFCTKKICSSSSDCNSPFGHCERGINGNVGECTCMFGFDGSHCNNPWLFLFIIVGGALLLITIALTFALVLRSSSKTETTQSSEGPSSGFPYKDLVNEEAEWNEIKGLRASVPKHPSANSKTGDNKAFSDRELNGGRSTSTH